MLFDYDRETDVLYVRFHEGGLVARTEEIDSGTLVDVDESGLPVGIEILRPARPIRVDEIAHRFSISADDIRVLNSLWAENAVFPYAVPEGIGAAS